MTLAGGVEHQAQSIGPGNTAEGALPTTGWPSSSKFLGSPAMPAAGKSCGAGRVYRDSVIEETGNRARRFPGRRHHWPDCRGHQSPLAAQRPSMNLQADDGGTSRRRSASIQMLTEPSGPWRPRVSAPHGTPPSSAPNPTTAKPVWQRSLTISHTGQGRNIPGCGTATPSCGRAPRSCPVAAPSARLKAAYHGFRRRGHRHPRAQVFLTVITFAPFGTRPVPLLVAGRRAFKSSKTIFQRHTIHADRCHVGWPPRDLQRRPERVHR